MRKIICILLCASVALWLLPLSASAQQSTLINGQRATILASAGAANTTTVYTINLPPGGSGGTLYFTFSAGGYAGATIAVSAGPDDAHQVNILAATALAAVATTQSFTVPATAGAVAQVTYTTAGATALTYQLAYAYGGVLDLTGTSDVNIVQYGGVATTLGQKVMASSVPIVIASDQSAVPVSGTVTANQGTGAGAAAPWSVRLSDGAAFYVGTQTGQLPAALVGGRLDTNLGAYGGVATTLGQKVMASSIPIVIASDQSAFTVNVGTFPANQPFNLAQVAGTATVTAGVAGLLAVGGPAAAGAAVSGSPVRIGFNNAGTTRDATGTTVGLDIRFSSVLSGVDALANANIANVNSGVLTVPLATAPWIYNGASWDRLRSASLANFPVSTTLTARNSIGATLVENGSHWTVNSAPVAGTQGSASIAAEVGVRHVAHVVCFSSGSTTAPALTSLQVNIRDGATGAGTVLMSFEVEIPAATGEDTAPFCTPPLNLVGTTNTAMTAEWSAGLANLRQTVTLTGFNLN